VTRRFVEAVSMMLAVVFVKLRSEKTVGGEVNSTVGISR